MFTNKPRDEKACWPVRCAERWPVAVILVLACAAGAWCGCTGRDNRGQIVQLSWAGQPSFNRWI